MRNAKYDQIGEKYNNTRKADPHILKCLLGLLSPNINGIYLDIGCGTGNYTSEFSNMGFKFIGIDPSKKMLEVARKINRTVDWRLGVAEETNLESESIDGIICSMSIHHWTDLEKGFLELKRVLKPNGNIVVFTSTSEQMKGYWLNHFFPLMMEKSINQMPSFRKIESAVSFAGLKVVKMMPYEVKTDLQDKFLYSGKSNPKLYLDENIRKGISSFASLSNVDEVSIGLEKLKKEISSGQIENTIASFQHNLGDYLFILINKDK